MLPTKVISLKMIVWKSYTRDMEGKSSIICFEFITILMFSDRGYLEREMKLLFGSKLRAEGGDGTLNLES